MFINLKIGGGIKERSESTIRYFNDIKSFPILSKKEESDLLYTVHNGSEREAIEARNKLISCHQRFVVASAKRQMTPGVELVDLVNEANIGLMEAIEKFDPKKNSKLLSYAAYYIKRNIDQFKISYGKVVRKKNGERIYHSVAKTRSKLAQQLEREPTTDEISQALKKTYGIRVRNANDIIDVRLTRIDNNEDNEECNDYSLSEMYEFNQATADLNNYNNTVNREDKLYRSSLIMSCLNKRERDIIKEIYGIGSLNNDNEESDLKYNSLEKKYGLTKERIRQIHRESIQKMKEYVEEHSI